MGAFIGVNIPLCFGTNELAGVISNSPNPWSGLDFDDGEFLFEFFDELCNDDPTVDRCLVKLGVLTDSFVVHKVFVIPVLILS